MMEPGEVIDIQIKENKTKKYFIWIVVLAILAAISFGSAFAIGKYTKLEIFKKGVPENQSPTRPDWFVFEINQFSLEYPKYWEVKENSENELVGAKISGEGSEIDLWLKESRSYKFTPEQTSKQNTLKESIIKVDSRDTKMKEFPYKDGSFFIIIELAQTEKLPKVTFWINAANEEFKKTSLEIIGTYKTKAIIIK